MRAFNAVEYICQEPTYGGFLRIHCNKILEQENSAYRFVGTELAPISEESDQTAVTDALEASVSIPSARAHLLTALQLISQKPDPDVRNSMKESISAVEAICQLITGVTTATLGEALKKIPGLHPALKQSLLTLYGYTSDGDGIRHAPSDGSTHLTVVDARFALVTCSAFRRDLIAQHAP